MGFLSSKKPPKGPDLVPVAEQQGELNKQNALDLANANRYTQVGPAGDRNEWITDPTTGAVSNVTSMGDRPQAYYNALMDTGTGAVNSFANKYYGGAGGGGAAPAVNNANVAWGHSGFNPSTIGGMYGPAASDSSPVNKDIQRDLDYSKLTAMPGEDIGKARQEAQDALYGRASGYLDPQWQQQEAATRTRLSNQGLVPGTPAYDRAYANEQRAKEAAYTGARQDAIAGGGAEAARAQAMALELRNQGKSEADTLGLFHNAAQDQGAKQWLQKYGADTSANAQIQSAGISAGASMSNAQLANQLGLRQQEYAEMMGMGNQAQDFLPQFGIDQGNVNPYAPADVYGATQDQYQNVLGRAGATKPGFGQQLALAGIQAAGAAARSGK